MRITAEQQKERKKEMARRLLEINARKREERLAEDEEQLNQLLSIKVNYPREIGKYTLKYCGIIK